MSLNNGTDRSQTFAQMNGLDFDNLNSDSTSNSTSNLEQTELEEIVTTRPVASHPLLKGVAISGGVLVIVMIFWMMISSLTGALNSPGEKVAQKKQTNIKSEIKSDEDEKGDLKTAMALTSQKDELQAVNKKEAETPTTMPTTTATVTPVATTAPVATTTATVKTQTQPLPINRTPPPPPLTPATRPRLVAQPQPVKQPVFNSVVTPKPVPVRSVLPQPATPTTSKDPMQEWLAAANVGNYSSNNTDIPTQEKPRGGIGTRPNRIERSDRNLSQSLPTNYNGDGKRVLVGSRAEGVIETPVAWVAGSITRQQQNTLVRLTQPLKASDGSEVLPKGSYIVAAVNSTSSEIAQMTAISALINNNGKTEEKPLTQNAVLILGKNGGVLKAEIRQGGNNLNNSLMSSLLSGLSRVAEIQNRADSSTTISSLSTTTTITNQDKNLLAGFTEGTINEILRGMKNNQELQQTQQQQKIFVIDAGKSVQIFVNQSIAI
jgi:hypothetical protein